MNSFRVLWILVFCLSFSAHAGEGKFKNMDFRQKAESKAKSRWTLQEWLEQKERNHMMDLWLSMSTPSPYEFFVKGSTLSYQTKLDPQTSEPETHQSTSGGVGAYATIVGLEGEYEHNAQERYHDLSGSVNLRIAGNAVQGTHLIALYGLRTRDGDDSGVKTRLSNQFAGGDLNLYFTRYFGLQGRYQHYFPTEDETLGTVTGSRSEAGAFLDFESLRVFGNWFSDKEIHDLNGSRSTIERTGIQAGVKLFF